MPIAFNAIACMLPWLAAAEIEVAGLLMGHVLQDAIECPACGACYSVLLPSQVPELESTLDELRQWVRRTCGDHPPIIQKQ